MKPVKLTQRTRDALKVQQARTRETQRRARAASVAIGGISGPGISPFGRERSSGFFVTGALYAMEVANPSTTLCPSCGRHNCFLGSNLYFSLAAPVGVPYRPFKPLAITTMPQLLTSLAPTASMLIGGSDVR